MSAADKLAQVLAEHTICWNGSFGQYECTEGDATYESAEHCDAEVDHAAHLAAVVLAHLTAEGWAQGREEWGVQGAIIHPVRSYDHGAATTLHAKHGMPVVRRRVTDWEPVEGERS